MEGSWSKGAREGRRRDSKGRIGRGSRGGETDRENGVKRTETERKMGREKWKEGWGSVRVVI